MGVCVCVCLCAREWLLPVSISVYVSVCVLLAAFQLYALFGSASATLCCPYPPPLPPGHAIKFKMLTFDCQLRLLTNIARIVGMTCGLVAAMTAETD